VPRPRPVFEHGASVVLDDGFAVMGAYHPSRQNTHTGRLTPSMLEDVFVAAKRTLQSG
jgi:uracil-DNA glycosylase